MSNLAEIIAIAEAQRERCFEAFRPITPDAGDDRGRWARLRAAEMAAIHCLQGIGARISQKHDGASISLAGIRSSCTAGFYGALQNWLRRAREKAILEGGAR